MAKTARKVSVSIPQDLDRAVERVRKKHDRTRSDVVQEALRRWLEEEALLVRTYEAGYRHKPEGRQERKAATAAMRLLAALDW